MSAVKVPSPEPSKQPKFHELLDNFHRNLAVYRENINRLENYVNELGNNIIQEEDKKVLSELRKEPTTITDKLDSAVYDFKYLNTCLEKINNRLSDFV